MERTYETVEVTREDQIAWVRFNRPEKRNAFSPQLNRDMVEVLWDLHGDDSTTVLVLTGKGESFSAGMDLKEYFREQEGSETAFLRARYDARTWMYELLRYYPKTTIAAVNGWCFGGGLQPLVSCDLAIAAEEARFGLSEVNWGILPGGSVTQDIALTMNYRDALYYILTGKAFDGQEARRVGLVNDVVPGAQLEDAVRELVADLSKLNPAVLRSAKETYKFARSMPEDEAYDYVSAKQAQLRGRDPEQGRRRGMSQFLDDKSFRPGLGPYERQQAGSSS
ncbi:p-hydroxycinnamoyl CoA hydratase/lyase [Nitriliruptoraceae bacterium ZYF776]|nr:p-hydroxycinnamoyl CoA hydratase/lyase [Profundirhabdus halotolerans]